MVFAVLTQDFGYQSRNLTPPASRSASSYLPSGELWAYGPEDADNRIAGQANDFCLLVTSRRHRDDVAVTASAPSGPLAGPRAGLPRPRRRRPPPGQFA